MADTLTDSGVQLEEKVRYEASDSVVAIPGEGRVFLYGDAWVEYGSMKMQAAVLEIDYSTNIVKAYGRNDSLGNRQGTPVFKEGSETMEADTIKYNLKTKKGKIYNALTKQGELLVIGNEIKKDSNDIIYMKNMKCIPCQEADAKTIFRATRAKIIPDDKIVTGPMYLEIAGVPTPLGLPFGFFPNTKKQHNGIVLPSYGYSPEQGFFLRDGGFYLGFSEKTDMTIRGDIYANGSWKLGAENNYYVLYKSRGRTFVSYTRFFQGEKEIPAETPNEPNAFRRNDAYVIEWQHTQDNKSNPSVRFSANVNFRNNQTFNRLTSVNSGQFLQNTFQSNIVFSKTWKFGVLSLNGIHSQNSLTKRMDLTLPALTFNVNRFYPFRRANVTRQNVFDKIQMHYVFEARNSITGHEDSIFTGDISERLRNGVRHSLPISTNFNILKYITATPALNLNSYMYTKSLRKDFVTDELGREAVIARTVDGGAIGYDANFSTSFNTQVYFDYVFRKGKVKQIRHLMIPTISYNYRPDFGQPQLGFYRQVQFDSTGRTQLYSIFEQGVFGGPAAGKINGLSFNLSNNVEGKFKQRSDTGVVFKKTTLIQNLGVVGGYNFAADSFKMQPLNISMRTLVFKYFDVVASSLFNPYELNTVTRRDRNVYLWQSDGRLARFSSGNIAVSTSLGSDMLQALKNIRRPSDQSNAAERGGEVRSDEPMEKLPWTLRVSYNLLLSNPDDRRIQPNHALNFSADMTPTKYWKVGVTSGFDFNTQKLSYTRVSIYRDLKCWEARIDWVPLGVQKSYMVSLNMKLSMLSDFKIPRQRQWFDNMQ